MKIRLGRSLVTIMGVVLGIAFLMSILTTQVLKKGVFGEQKARLEIKRMENFLKAEMGHPAGKAIGVVQSGQLSDMEKRFVRHLAGLGVKAFHWHYLDNAARQDIPELTANLGNLLAEAPPKNLAESNHIVLLMGAGQAPTQLWEDVYAGMTTKRLAMTQAIAERRIPAAIHPTPLARQLRQDELAKLVAEKRKEQYRNTWIIIISLVVTVIGISNAMLMSVTERFREIGTMKCLGALSAFVRQIFLIESCIIGAIGGIGGSILGSLFTIMVYAFTFGFGLVSTSLAESLGRLLLYLLLACCAGVMLSIVAAIYPANVASKMMPANALRSNV